MSLPAIAMGRSSRVAGGTRAAWRVGDLDASHAPQIRALFETVFARPMSQALWDWKYSGGQGVASGVWWGDGALVAHYGGTRRAFCAQGNRLTATHIGDVMVHPGARDVLSRKGPFGSLTAHFVNTHCHPDPIGPGFGFGFPNARHMRLGQILGLYDWLDEVFELQAALPIASDGSGPPAGAQVRPVDWSDPATGTLLDQLWHEMEVSLAGWGLGERSSAWWRHRYANHPEHEHECHWVLGGPSHQPQPLACVALRRWTQPGTWELLDWVAGADRAPLVWPVIEGYVSQRGCTRLTAWVTSGVARRMQLPSRVTAQSACPLAATCAAGQLLPHVRQMRERTWVTGGDTDFR